MVQDTISTAEQQFKGICPKHVVWADPPAPYCAGRYIRAICNFGIGDLSKMQSSECLLANKFNMDVSADATYAQFLYMIALSEAIIM